MHSMIQSKKALTLFLLATFMGLTLLILNASQPVAAATTITVTTTADVVNNDALCSLREAVTAANTDSPFNGCPAGSGADTIELSADTYTMALNPAGEDLNAGGDFDISDDLIIKGASQTGTIIDGDQIDRLFHITNSGISVSFEDLTITNGHAPDGASPENGGGVYAQGTVSFLRVTVSNNSAGSGTITAFGGHGGGIFMKVLEGTLTITDSNISRNRSGDGSSGSAINGDAGFGGGVYTGSPTTISGSTFTGNWTGDGGSATAIANGNGAQGGHGGGLYVGYGADNSIIENSAFTGNWTGAGGESGFDNGNAADGGDGGAIHVCCGAQITRIRNQVIISGNWTGKGGDGRDTGGDGGSGGGLMVDRNAEVTVSDSTIKDNHTGIAGLDTADGSSNGQNGVGGGVAGDNRGRATITNVSISNNYASGHGGGVQIRQNAIVTLDRSIIYNNIAAENGGGFYIGPVGNEESSMLLAINSTFSGNVAQDGGGVFIISGNDARFINVTISDNSALSGTGGGLVSEGTADNGDVVSAENTIIAHQRAGDDCDLAQSLSLLSDDYNLESSISCGFTATNDKQNADAALDPLANNGGPTKTHALRLDSEALNAGNTITCTDDLVNSQDQRGISRPQPAAGNCDIGAYELTGGELTIIKEANPADGTNFIFEISPNIPFQTPPAFELAWGGFGPGASQFFSAVGIGLDAAGNIYATDPSGKVKIFDNNGLYLNSFGSFGTGDGEFMNSVDVAVDSVGNIYVVDSENNRIQKFDSSGNFINKWGSLGNADGEFNRPISIVIDAFDNVFVSDYFNNRIQKFDSNGNFILMWGKNVKGGGVSEICYAVDVPSCQQGSSGSDDGAFNRPYGLALDAAGNILVADSDNNRIQKFSNNGAFIFKFGVFGDQEGEMDEPYGVGVDQDGNILVADSRNHRMQKFSATGGYLLFWGSEGNSLDGHFGRPGDVVVDGSGNVFVSDFANDGIQKFKPVDLVLDHAIPDNLDGIPQQATAVVDAGVYAIEELLPDLWSIENISCTKEIDDPTITGNPPQDPITQPIELTVSYGDKITCTFTNNGRGDIYLTKETEPADGTGFELFVTNFVNPSNNSSYVGGVDTDSNGNVYVVDGNNHRVIKYDNKLAPIATWGSLGTSEGKFRGPYGIAVDSNDNVYVVDSNNYRIQQFDSSGSFIRMWGKGVDGGLGFESCTAGCVAGSQGSALGELSYSSQIDVDALGNIYVTDTGNFRVNKYSSDLLTLRTWGWGVNSNTAQFEVCTVGCFTGQLGSGVGQFDNAQGIAADGLGNIYVADLNLGRVQLFDVSGGLLSELDPGNLPFPSAITTDSANNVYVAQNASNVRIYNSGGALIDVLSNLYTEFENLQDLAVDQQGTIFGTDNFVNNFQESFVRRVQRLLFNDSQYRAVTNMLAGQVSIKERVQSGWQLTEVSCLDSEYVPIHLGELIGLDLTLHSKEEAVCTFTNTALGSITVTKQTLPPGGSGFNFLLTGEGDDIYFLKEWGEEGTADGQFDSPSWIALDGDGNVYVTDDNNNRIQKFDAAGNHLLSWGSFGTTAGKFDDPWGIAIHNNRVYVADGNNDRIQVFDKNGNFQEAWGWGVTDGSDAYQICTDNSGCQDGRNPSGNADGGSFDTPGGIGVDSSGNVYVTDTENYRVQKFSSSGAFERMWGYAVDTGDFLSFEICTANCQEGAAGSSNGQFLNPRSLVVNNSDQIFVLDRENNHVQKFSSSGTFLEAWGWGVKTGANMFEICLPADICQAGIAGSGQGQFNNAEGIGIDDNDNVYIADGGNVRLQMLDKDGNFITTWGRLGNGEGELDDPEGIVINSDGKIYVVDEDKNKVLIYARDPLAFTLDDGQSYTLENLLPKPYKIEEHNLPQGWTLDNIDCGNSAVEGIDNEVHLFLQPGEDATCTFTNVAAGEPSIKVNKDVDPSEVWEPGGDVDFIFDTWNNGDVPVTITDIDDSYFGNLSDECNLPVDLPAGQTYTCRITEYIGGNGGDIHYNQVTVTAVDGQQNEVKDTSDEDVHILDIPSSIKVEKDAAKSEVLEPGEDLTFTITVKNTSPVDEVTIESVSDNVYGDLTAECLPGGPETLQVGETFTCDFTRYVGGQTGDIHNNTVTVLGTDDDGQAVSDSDSEQVQIDNVASSIKVDLRAGPDQVYEPGDDVTFTVDIHNSSTADSVMIEQIKDDVFGDVTAECLAGTAVTLNPGSTHTCTFTRFIGGQMGDLHNGQVSVLGTDDDGHAVSDTAGDSVLILDTPSSLLVTQTVNPQQVVAPGGDVTFTVTILNDSVADEVTVNSLDDTVYPGIAANCAPALPATIKPGESIICSMTTYIGGQSGDVFSSRATASGQDDDGYPVGDGSEVSIHIVQAPYYTIFFPSIRGFR